MLTSTAERLLPLEQASFDFGSDGASQAASQTTRSGTFTDNMKLPVHRWFRYSAGFSAQWVEDVVRSHGSRQGLLFDPFSGSGTSLLAAQARGMPSAGAEPHPFVLRIASAKSCWTSDVDEFSNRAAKLLTRAEKLSGPHDVQSSLILRCYEESALCQLEALRLAFAAEPANDPASELLWLAITSILRECSSAGTAQWQYILPNKSKAKVREPFTAFRARVLMFESDMREMQMTISAPPPFELTADDARSLQKFGNLHGKVSLVVTSPPYPNNYDYADATRLEMTFWREIDGWSDLQKKVRHGLVRSCSQHSAAEKLNLESLLTHPAIESIRSELTLACRELEVVRQDKGGKKAYHTMAGAYFIDLAETWIALRRLCAKDATVCFVIGDSAPYGVYLPVDEWLAELAVAAGFRNPRFEKIRDRNLKWKNRKHTVPLKEGRLWVTG